MSITENTAARQDAPANGASTHNGQPDFRRTATETQCPPKPRVLTVLSDNIPAELTQHNNWVLSRLTWKPAKLKWDKPPLTDADTPASSTDPQTWTSFNAAIRAYEHRNFDCLGFALSAALQIVAIDLDGSRDPETGETAPEAQEIIDRAGSYTELSPSGTGHRIFVIGVFPDTGRKTKAPWKKGNEKAEIEVAADKKYMTVTGHHCEGTPGTIENGLKFLAWLHSKYFKKPEPVSPRYTAPLDLDDNAILEKAMNAKNSAKFMALWNGDTGAYPSPSEGESAFCCLLAFYTRDAAQIERLWLASGLNRDKTQRADYRERTIKNALEKVTEHYDPTPRATRAPDPAKVANGETDTRPDAPTDEDKFVITPGFPLTDTGNGERFIAQHGRRVLYSGALGWLFWNGRYWEPDENNAVFEMGKRTVRSIYAEASHAEDDDRIKIATWAKNSESYARRNAMIEIASKDGASIKVKTEQLDTHKMLLNVQNGTIDLETGELREPDRAHRLTKSSPVVYDPRADAPTFYKFLFAVLDNDMEAAEFLQRFMGYTLTGLTREQCFLILHGDGSNGKSTLLNVLRWLLGPYCKQTKPDTLMKRKFGDGIPNDVAMLRGSRMVTAIETNEGRQFDEAKIKEMTGGDPVTARFFRKEFFEFEPEFKLYLATNHKPQIIGDDEGIWRRVRLLPFNVHFWNPDKGEAGPEHLKADKTLADKLKAELPGILAWAVQGCLEWQHDGLPEPKIVTDATAAYKTESDPVATFLSERCFCVAHCETPNALLYDEFKKWANAEEEAELSNKAFTTRMKQKGFENTRGTGGLRKWKGVGLLATDQLSNVYRGGK